MRLNSPFGSEETYTRSGKSSPTVVQNGTLGQYHSRPWWCPCGGREQRPTKLGREALQSRVGVLRPPLIVVVLTVLLCAATVGTVIAAHSPMPQLSGDQLLRNRAFDRISEDKCSKRNNLNVCVALSLRSGCRGRTCVAPESTSLSALRLPPAFHG